MMKVRGIRNFAIAAGLGIVFVLAGTIDANAQSRWELERERDRAIQIQQQRERDRQRQMRNRRDRRNPGVYRDNTYGRAVVSQPMGRGYENGFKAGAADRRKGKYGRLNVYRNTGSSYPNSGDASGTDYYYRQGYLQGYDDGFYGRYRY